MGSQWDGAIQRHSNIEMGGPVGLGQYRDRKTERWGASGMWNIDRMEKENQLDRAVKYAISSIEMGCL